MAAGVWGPTPNGDRPYIPSKAVDLFNTPLAAASTAPPPPIEAPPKPVLPEDNSDVQQPTVGDVEEADKIRLFQRQVAPLAPETSDAKTTLMGHARPAQATPLANDRDRLKAQIAAIPSLALHKLQGYLQEGRLEDADREAAILENNFPDAPDPLAYRAQIDLQMRRFPEARQRLESAMQKAGQQIKLLNELALLEQRASRPQEARQVATDAAKMTKRLGEMAFLAGSSAHMTGDTAGAIANWRLSTRHDPQNANGYIALSKVYTRQGELDRATAALQELLRLDPKRADAYNDLGLLYLRAGDTAKAEQSFRQSLTLNPRDPNAHNNLGVLHEHRQEWSKAEQAFRNTLQLEPRHPQAHFNLAKVALVKKDLPQAGLLLQKAIALDPHLKGEAIANPLFTALKSHPTYGHLLGH